MEKKCYAELNLNSGLAIRIFRNKKMAVIYAVNPNRGMSPEPNIRYMDRATAVGQIRLQVFGRDCFRCVECDAPVVWERGHSNSGEMDERQARGDCVQGENGLCHSGEISVENGQTLCHRCHVTKTDRDPVFSHDIGGEG